MKVSTAELLAMRKVRRRKIRTCRYVGKLLQALFQERPLPVKPGFDDPQIRDKIEQLAVHIVSLYKEFREQL
jgi:hypothetical protein